MNKISVTGAMAVLIIAVVFIAGCVNPLAPSTPQTQTAGTNQAATASAGAKSTSATTNVAAVPGQRIATKFVDLQASKTGDLYLGDQIVTTGRLVDANGNGIPNQTVTFRAIAHVFGITQDVSPGSATTDSTGAFKRVETVTSHGAPSFIKTVNSEGWI
ncbi:MAG: hypothetical protein ACXV6L_10270, partial [Halobacteriota archaeon]